MSVGIGVTSISAPDDAAEAADLSKFRAGNIIADAVFYNSAAMDEAKIQSFLNARVPTCASGYVCLKSYSTATTSRAADAYCSAYSGGSVETAARIIAKVAKACGINPQVLIVTLQKEQGLVTATAPTSTKYRIAMGYACPDTAACDSQYYGFFNQVYSAARQFQVYSKSSTFTWYAPGKTWNIRYHPNSSCGSSPVYIENQATANLYYYTPYQPNSAALAAGYGVGDACSAYGNRNFYSYFTDWFGSTQNTTTLVRGAGQSHVWLLAGGRRWHISDGADYQVYLSRLGPLTSVTVDYVESIPIGGYATRYVHDPRTGTLYLLQADGTKHRFPTAERVAQFGYEFNSYVDLDAKQIDAFTTGPEVGTLFNVEGAKEVYQLSGTTKRYIPNMTVFNWVTRNSPTFIARMSSRGAGELTAGPSLLKPRTAFRESSATAVWFAVDDTTMVRSTAGMAAEYGSGSVQVIANGSLTASPQVPGGLKPFATCGGSTFLAASGKLHPVTGTDYGGFTPTPLPSSACPHFAASGTGVAAKFFVKRSGLPEVYVLEGGKLRHVTSYDLLKKLNGNRELQIQTWSASTASGVGFAAPILASGAFVQFSGSSEVYYFDGTNLRHVRTYETLVRLGGGKVPPIISISNSFRGSYTFGDPL